jgi:hypothetical protein
MTKEKYFFTDRFWNEGADEDKSKRKGFVSYKVYYTKIVLSKNNKIKNTNI